MVMYSCITEKEVTLSFGCNKKDKHIFWGLNWKVTKRLDAWIKLTKYDTYP